MMTRLFKRVARQFKRPLPEFCTYLRCKLVSMVWRPYLGSVGREFHISPGARLQGGGSIRIGNRFHGGPHLWIEAVHDYLGHRYTPSIVIGDGVVCSHFVHIAATDAVTIGNGVLIGSGVHITDHAHGVYRGALQDDLELPPSLRRLDQGRPVVVSDNVWLGDGVVVLPGVTIGRGTIVGANSVVTKSLPEGVMAVGSPARPIKRFDAAIRQWLPIQDAPKSI